MPGLRIAYAVAEPAVGAGLLRLLPPWPVSTLAVHATLAALADRAFAQTALALNEERRESLGRSLKSLGVRHARASANFLLLEIPHARLLWERMLRRHAILLRRCDNFETLGDAHLRTAVRDEAANARLLSAFRLELSAL